MPDSDFIPARARHARLFELIRQGHYAALVSERLESKVTPASGAARLFAHTAAASLRGVAV